MTPDEIKSELVRIIDLTSDAETERIARQSGTALLDGRIGDALHYLTSARRQYHATSGGSLSDVMHATPIT